MTAECEPGNSFRPSIFWWSLSLCIPLELEESFLWKLDQLDIKRAALEYSSTNKDELILRLWLPFSDWSHLDRERLIDSFRPLGNPFDWSLHDAVWEKVVDEDWSQSWKRNWQPDPIGKNLLILPSWLEAPALYSERTVIRIDPGSAFGTGSHPSTRLCLQTIEINPPCDLKVLDLGCGSGVLGLAALNLGAKQVLAVDIDSLSVSSALKNKELNGFDEGQLTVSLGSIETLESLLGGELADLMLCNILAPVIEKLAPKFESVLSPSGRALLSGLLVDQAPKLKQTLETLGWSATAMHRDGDWAMLEASKSKAA